MDVLYFIKEQRWMSAIDEGTLKTISGGSTPSSKLILKIKWYHGCGCYNNSRSYK